jgi:DNA-binding NarL/FixJ family response regulator
VATSEIRTIGVLLVDDHDVVRGGVRALLEVEPDLTVVGEAGTAKGGVELAGTLGPDVVLLDLQLPDGSGIDACRDIRAHDPEVRVLVLTSSAEDDALLAAILAGADAYVLKHVRGNDLVASVRAVAAGRPLLDPRAKARILDGLRHRQPGATVSGLTAQESRIFDLLADGMTNREIGTQLHIAEKTVKNYVSNVLMKLGVQRRTEVVVRAASERERRLHDRHAPSGAAIRY